MSYDLIYVNGDSYVAFAQGHAMDHYLSKHFGISSVNMAIGGACNSRILRTSLRDAIRLKDKKILMIIGLSMLLRSEVWIDNYGAGTKEKFNNDGDFHSFQIMKGIKHDRESFPNLQSYEYFKAFYQNYSEEAAYVNLLRDIIGFTSYCQYNNIDYVMFSCFEKMPNPKVDPNTAFIKDLHDHVKADDRILPLDNFCFTDYCLSNGFIPFDYDKWGITGHHGTEAHEHFARFLTNRFKW